MQESSGRRECGSLVSLREGVVARDADQKGGGEDGEIVLTIGPMIGQPRERAFDQAPVPNLEGLVGEPEAPN